MIKIKLQEEAARTPTEGFMLGFQPPR